MKSDAGANDKVSDSEAQIGSQSDVIIRAASWRSKLGLISLHNISHARKILELLVDRGFEIKFAALAGGEFVVVGITSEVLMNGFIGRDW